MYMFETAETFFSLNWFLISTQSDLILEMSLVFLEFKLTRQWCRKGTIGFISILGNVVTSAFSGLISSNTLIPEDSKNVFPLL